MPIPETTQAIQWHKYRGSDGGLRWLRSLMREAVQAMDRDLAEPDAAVSPPGAA
jgi:hypothetical protein